MRNLILLTLALASTPAFAIHAYDEVNCSGTANGRAVTTDEPRASSGDIVVHAPLPGHEDDDGLLGRIVGAKDKAELGTDDQIVVVNVLEKNRISKKYNDGCWIGTEGSFARTVRVGAITPAGTQSTGLQAGQTIQLQCKFFKAEPDGPNCE